MLGGHRLAGKEYALEPPRHVIVEDMAVAHQYNGRCRPQDSGNAAFVEQLDEQLWESEVFLTDDIERGPCFQADIDILDRAVKIKWRLVSQGISLVKAEAVYEPLSKVYYTAMTDDNPFGYTRRTASKYGIQWIGINNLRTYIGEQFQVTLLFNGCLIVNHHSIKTDSLQHLGIPGCYRDSRNGVKHLNDETDAGLRHLVVDRHIEVATLDHAHKAHQALYLAVYKYQHGAPHSS